MRKAAALILMFLMACAPTAPAGTMERVDVYATSAAGPWLDEMFDCAADLSVVLNVSADAADITLRVGEPEGLVSYAYQIDTEEILIAAHRESPLQNLTLSQVRDLFAGRGDPSVQVWVYASGEDIARAFDQLVMQGRSVTSFTRLAVSPQHMAEVLNADVNAVGILPRHWMTGNVREVFSAGSVPVLALTQSEPQGVIHQLIGCLQAK
ncbi:MAG: hypothetical protein ACOYZ8_07900 [Chloroflexota bacterium]